MASNVKIRLKGHESFYIREGWLRKGTRAIQENPYILSDITAAVDELGVGSNMVKAIRYWLQAIGLTVESIGINSKRKQVQREDFGDIILKGDPYFEDLGTLFLLHYKLVSNKESATSWYLFFNKINVTELSKETMFEGIKQELLKMDPTMDISEQSIKDDCTCIIKTYFTEKNDLKDPEDNMVCPFSELGLINKIQVKNKEELINKLTPNRTKLDELIILYVILDNLKGHRSISIKNLIEDENNIGKVFNLDKNSINEYIDILEEKGYIKITRAAGLNMIYPTKLDEVEVLRKYYSGIQESAQDEIF
ncbi:DUF4007 family protein [Clostridium chromiireducens]|uniref:DUF4007 domain-containing protein n=1 Tax=Clostridium chromiireducens TaxID=225345 RepID=A0A1V4I5G5_9CLOT|nr:DUF4007 family protein [Clostridium chromiireducens]OPJ55206.1 hypothetical protein CLCHR_47110 [Clostridium chromiireducens]